MDRSTQASHVKYLISAEEYERLNRIEQKYIELQKELKNNLSKSASEQVGSGNLSTDSGTIVDKVVNHFLPSVSNINEKYTTQDTDIIPPIVGLEKKRPKILTEYSVPIIKDDENNRFDEKRLLNFVPKPKRNKARELLEIFNTRGSELTWNSNGVIFIDQLAVPKTDIYLLFPYLFKKQKPKHEGYNILVQKINDMGLQDYITLPVSSHQQISSEKELDEKDIPWYYIGD